MATDVATHNVSKKIAHILIDHMSGYTIGFVFHDGKFRIVNAEGEAYEVSVKKVR